ncbi:MAG: metal ABC transporter permease [Pseudomonadota bacterium]|nr:metal ABC transporter permease [Pseudomonadota bacterium]
MTGFLDALADQAFLQRALLAGMLASLGCGLIGPWVLIRRMSHLAGGIAHAVLGGLGIAFFLGGSPLVGAIAAAVVVALLIGLIHLYWETQEDLLTGALWSVGMAVGLLFIYDTPGATTDLMSYLFGNILLVSARDLWFMLLIDMLVLGIVVLLHRHFLAISLDEAFARSRGIPVAATYLILLILVALSVVLLIRVAGLILVMALITLPAAACSLFARSIAALTIGATTLAISCTTAGLALSYAPDWPAGPTIILVCAFAYGATLILATLRRRIRHPIAR